MEKSSPIAVTSITRKRDAGHGVGYRLSSIKCTGLMSDLLPPSENRFRFVSRGKSRATPGNNLLGSPYGMQVIESCATCIHREHRPFCNLTPAALQDLSKIAGPATYPKGAVLFGERQSPRGVFILCEGHVKLSTSSADGRTVILQISEPGDLLGLPATIAGRPYEVTADVIEPTQVNFISRADFLKFLDEHGEAAMRVIEQLSEAYHSAFTDIRTIGIAHSAKEKLARFILDWIADHNSEKGAIKAELTLTHEEIAQMIGTSRETVTRLFAQFRRENLLQVKGSTLMIKNKSGLETLVKGS
jgi:CRP/FNR family cyclic AMP-dependent transcriptional regulator